MNDSNGAETLKLEGIVKSIQSGSVHEGINRQGGSISVAQIMIAILDNNGTLYNTLLKKRFTDGMAREYIKLVEASIPLNTRVRVEVKDTEPLYEIVGDYGIVSDQ